MLNYSMRIPASDVLTLVNELPMNQPIKAVLVKQGETAKIIFADKREIQINLPKETRLPDNPIKIELNIFSIHPKIKLQIRINSEDKNKRVNPNSINSSRLLSTADLFREGNANRTAIENRQSQIEQLIQSLDNNKSTNSNILDSDNNLSIKRLIQSNKLPVQEVAVKQAHINSRGAQIKDIEQIKNQIHLSKTIQPQNFKIPTVNADVSLVVTDKLSVPNRILQSTSSTENNNLSLNTQKEVSQLLSNTTTTISQKLNPQSNQTNQRAIVTNPLATKMTTLSDFSIGESAIKDRTIQVFIELKQNASPSFNKAETIQMQNNLINAQKGADDGSMKNILTSTEEIIQRNEKNPESSLTAPMKTNREADKSILNSSQYVTHKINTPHNLGKSQSANLLTNDINQPLKQIIKDHDLSMKIDDINNKQNTTKTLKNFPGKTDSSQSKIESNPVKVNSPDIIQSVKTLANSNNAIENILEEKSSNQLSITKKNPLDINDKANLLKMTYNSQEKPSQLHLIKSLDNLIKDIMQFPKKPALELIQKIGHTLTKDFIPTQSTNQLSQSIKEHIKNSGMLYESKLFQSLTNTATSIQELSKNSLDIANDTKSKLLDIIQTIPYLISSQPSQFLNTSYIFNNTDIAMVIIQIRNLLNQSAKSQSNSGQTGKPTEPLINWLSQILKTSSQMLENIEHQQSRSIQHQNSNQPLILQFQIPIKIDHQESWVSVELEEKNAQQKKGKNSEKLLKIQLQFNFGEGKKLQVITSIHKDNMQVKFFGDDYFTQKFNQNNLVRLKSNIESKIQKNVKISFIKSSNSNDFDHQIHVEV